MMDKTPPSKREKFPGGNPCDTDDEQAGMKRITPEILYALRNGEAEAYRVVYLHYITPIRDFLTPLLRSADDAEEMAQDILLNLWENRAKIDPEKNIKSYLFTIARNAALDHFRHKQVQQKYAVEYQHHGEKDVSGDEILDAKESELLVRIVYSRMPPQRQKVFELSRWEGLTYEQIAQQLKISRKAVEYHISAALKEIKKILTFCLAFIIWISVWIYNSGV